MVRRGVQKLETGRKCLSIPEQSAKREASGQFVQKTQLDLNLAKLSVAVEFG